MRLISQVRRCLYEAENDDPKVVTIKKCDGEFRVPAKDGKEAGAYYTDDKDDACATAKAIHGDNIVCKFRSVSEFILTESDDTDDDDDTWEAWDGTKYKRSDVVYVKRPSGSMTDVVGYDAKSGKFKTLRGYVSKDELPTETVQQLMKRFA